MASDGQPSGRAAASRRNGAKSRGPKTAGGRKRSSQNARQHGLRADPATVLAALPEWLSELGKALAAQADGSPQAAALIDRILAAEFSRRRAGDRATALIDELAGTGGLEFYRDMLGPAGWTAALRRLEFPASIARVTFKSMAGNWAHLTRMLAYERRFRGQRDRALRELARLATLPPE